MRKHRVIISMGRRTDDNLISFGWGVHLNLYAEPAYANVPFPAEELAATITAFSDAKVAQANGGKAATAEKNQRREDLIDMLQSLAYYVQVACKGDLAVLLSSGFEAASLNRTPQPLGKPALVRIVPGMSGQSLVTMRGDKTTRAYEIIVAEIDGNGAPGPYRPAVTRSSSLNIPISDLIPGKQYAYQGRSVGGAKTFSDWSDMVVHRAA